MDTFRKFVIGEARANGVSFQFFPSGDALIYEHIPGKPKTYGWHRFYRVTHGVRDWITESAKGKGVLRHIPLEVVS